SPDGQTLVVVKENNGANPAALNFNLKNFNAEKITKVYTDNSNNWTTNVLWTKGENENSADGFGDTVTPYSVTTYVIEGSSSSKVGGAHIIDDSARVSTDRIAVMQTEIGNNPEKEALYTAGTWKEDNAGNNPKNAFAGKTIWNSSDNNSAAHYIAVRFYGTGIGVLGERKSDSAVLQYWCDPTGSGLPATADGEVDTSYSAGHLYKQQIMRVNNLDEGWHTIYLKVASGYLNLDGVFVINGKDNTATVSKPVVTGAFGGNKTLYVNYEGVDGATDYKVEYRKAGDNNWTTESVTTTSAKNTNSAFVTGEYQVRVTATKDSNTISSNIISTNMNAT
ncbi:MAG: hypothetical protein K2N74_06540, partial [Clostridiales bacterium]|nr:hypothetical protein [Clostridiales bacterium]